jgi:hypothetical protein
VHGCKGGVHGREGARTEGRDRVHGREGGCARVMGRARTGGDGGTHDGSLHQF